MTDPLHDTQPTFVAIHEKPKAKRDDPPPTRGGCLIPVWSVLLTVIMAFACAFAILAAAIALGGDDAPGGEPQIVVIPVQITPTSPLVVLQTTPTPTLIPAADQIVLQATFALSGPMLAPVVFTPTPMGISVGALVSVDVDGGLNIRPQPGVDNTELYRANYGELYNVVAGPENVNGLTWWRLQDPTNPNRGGWAAGEYLIVVPPTP
jgi:hypothetical protein